MRIEEGTWVLVLDGEKALILENAGDAAAPSLRQVAKDLNADPGSPGDSSDGDRAAEQRHATHHAEAEPDFLRETARGLYRDAHRGRFRRLVLVAGPEALGRLRRHLHAEVEARVVAEVHKTLTRHPLPEIERILAAERG